jgi:hypothetical protein
MIFETMAFPREGDWHELDCRCYPDETAALAGHELMVARYQARKRTVDS